MQREFPKLESQSEIMRLESEPELRVLASDRNYNDSNTIHKEAYCTCGTILLRRDLLEAYYCERCKKFICGKCERDFSKKMTCNCRRCTCCFLEVCLPGQIIGKQCQNMCQICYEENEPTLYNISRYPCGHGICRICILSHAVQEDFEPKKCYVCHKK